MAGGVTIQAAIMSYLKKCVVMYIVMIFSMHVQVMLCSELLANGDLRSYLQSIDLRYTHAQLYILEE